MKNLTFIELLTILIVGVILYPILLYCAGYAIGFITKITIGTQVCAGLNALFGTKCFIPKMLPIIGGALFWIGGLVNPQFMIEGGIRENEN